MILRVLEAIAERPLWLAWFVVFWMVVVAATAESTSLYRGDAEVTPTCEELQSQVRFLASIMVASKGAGRRAGCIDQRDSACYAHTYVYLKAQELGRMMATIHMEKCRVL